ncbi:hypothetical protein [Campylobacter subantarcticus]|uniref:FemAB family protein n=1 Tax=Campylobacter subantarcticus LMG 24374 TaxID=1388751 RepID=A0A0A8HE92_9BACT|nr:hypothetical protein [Campylobacter subantarcticus]AJC91244.1 hypothetical protein CSUB8521_1420 [Campylobacter subantarcticus LMG 24374]EAJ1261373.1 hypothetical protein [Campylobacter lari]
MQFNNDIYLNENYVKLYGEVFVFENFDGDKYFKIIANKYPIKSSKYFDLQSVYGYGGGISCNSKDENFIKQSIIKFKNTAKEQNIIAFFIRFHPFDLNIDIYKKYLNFFRQEKKIIIVDTSNTIIQIRKQYKKKNKYAINQARRLIEILQCDKNETLSFYELYQKTMLRNNASKFYFFDKEYFENLWNFEDYVVFKARLNNEDIAFASFFMGEEITYYHFSANTLKNNANALLLDHFFEFSNQKGKQKCILGGGIKDDDSLFAFKSKFSKQFIYFCIGGIVINDEVYNNMCEKYDNSYFLKYRN